MSPKCGKLSGNWEGFGIEQNLDVSGNVSETKLRLVKQIVKVAKDTYKVTDTYYYEDNTINYGPVTYLIGTGGNKKNFMNEDDSGMGINFTKVDGTCMNFRYNANGLPIDELNPYPSLDGTYELKKIPTPM